jgi:hypothetical protein
MLRSAALLATVLSAAGLRPAVLPRQASCMGAPASRTSPITMINLFGNNEESQKRRSALSFRSAQPGDRKVSFRKPNTATEGLSLGLKFREAPFTKAVYIDKIVEGTEAARLKRQGLIKEGDEIVMVSATFGGEMWSARGVGKYRLEKSIAVRQGMTIDFVFEGSDDNSKKRMNELAKKKKAESVRLSRLQQQLTAEVEAEKKKGWGLW